MLTLFGFEFAADKLLPFEQTCEVLGVKLDLSLAHEGEIRITNKPSRIEEVRGLLESAVALKALVPAKVPRFIGKLQYADSQVWGRAGRIALGDLRSLGGSGRHAVNLVLKARFELGRPLSIKASVPVPPAVIFTDGALEEGKATIGGVLYPSCRQMPAEVFGATLPCNVLELLKGDKEHVIGAVELFAVAVAIKLWMPRLTGQRVLVFVDNWPALDTLVRGTAGVQEWRQVLLSIEGAEGGQPPLYWFARVPSGSNVADDPS
ncbi:unnamed protein product, partial [Symbiodinium sp. CCMP2456]